MTDTVPETTNPVVAILAARRAELVGGEQSIGEQRRLIAEKQAAIDADLAALAACESELAEIDRAIALVQPPEPPVEIPEAIDEEGIA